VRARLFHGPLVAASIAGLAAASCLVVLPAAASGVLSPAKPAPAQPTSVKQAVAQGTGGAVASAELYASRAGIEILKAGGNAVDAAVATAAVLGVTEPFVAGPGGGGFMVIRLAKTNQVVTIDGREMCPSSCTPKLFIDPATDKPLPFEEARHSGLSVGVPGMVATWAKAVEKYGQLSFKAVLQPAIRVAKHGFTVSPNFVQQDQAALPDLQAFTSSRELFLTPEGQPLPVGSILKNPDLARTYQDLAEHGPGFLYGGPLGKQIADSVQHPPVWSGTPLTVRPGTMTAKDVRNYEVKLRQPTHIKYRGRDIYSMAPSSSGGITTGEALNIMQGWNLSGETREQATFHYLEASRLAFADRNAYVGDSDYVDVPQKGLLNPAFAATRRCLVQDKALTSPVAPGKPFAPFTTPTSCAATTAAPNPSQEGTETNHLVTADKSGNVVSYTNTIEQVAGSGITVPGRGFLLNNENTDFDMAPSAPGVYDPNLPAPGKRPRSSMSPTIVMKNGVPDFTLGSPGGSTIITTVLQTLMNHIDLGMSLPDALAAPRVSQRNTATSTAEPAFYNSELRKKLTTQFGEQFTEATGAVLPLNGWIGKASGIKFLPGGRFQAAAEPVRQGGGSALVVNPE
jgi:gamma-glutamyltranspeptidase/glutathione hydrolase